MKSPFALKSGALLTILLTALNTQAGLPFNSLEGEGGVIFNPLAYTAGQKQTETNSTSAWLGKPQVGIWGARFANHDINWGSVGVAETFGQRLEISYAYEAVRLGTPPTDVVDMNNVGAKLLLVRENEGGLNFIPALAVGAIWKSTDVSMAKNGDGPDRAAMDYYAVATKTITQLPIPVLLSGGLLSTKEQLTGIVGFDNQRELAWFGNVDVFPVSFLATGLEYKQGTKFNDNDGGFANPTYWDAHVAWLATQNLSLIAAYAFTGRDFYNSNRAGLGGGFMVSAQYAF